MLVTPKKNKNLDIDKIRRDFPILKIKSNNKPLIFFDNGASSQKPKVVIDKIKEIYNYSDKSFYINGIIDLTNSKVKVSRLNFNKDYGKKSELNFDVNFVLDKYYNIDNLNFSADKTNIRLSHLKLNKNFEVKDFRKFEIKTYENEIKNNDFLVKKLEKVTISGEVFDAEPLLKSLYKKNDEKIFISSGSKLYWNYSGCCVGCFVGFL